MNGRRFTTIQKQTIAINAALFRLARLLTSSEPGLDIFDYSEMPREKVIEHTRAYAIAMHAMAHEIMEYRRRDLIDAKKPAM